MYSNSLFQEDREKIELFISCRQLADLDTFSKSDPQVIVYMQGQNKKWIQIGKTEVVYDNLNPDFNTSLQLDYIFEQNQQLKFDCIDFDGQGQHDTIGSAECTLGKIVGARCSTCIVELKNQDGKTSGKLILRSEKLGQNSNFLLCQIKGQKIADLHIFSKTSPFLRILKQRDDGTFLQIHETEHLHKNLNPLFAPFEISISKLCSNQLQRPIKIQCWDYETSGKHQLVGEAQFTLQQLESQQFQSIALLKSGKNAGTLIFELKKFFSKPQFIDFIRGGTQLSLVMAIDYTASNKLPTKPDSLHYISQNQLNSYQQAIYAIGNILINYDYTKLVPAYGFGGKPRYQHFNFNQVLHCFPINGYPQAPHVNGVDGLMQIYCQSLPFIELSGPTLFNPIITETMKIAQLNQAQGNDIYSILVILTDGTIHDMEPTITSIVNSSLLPLSIIIIGIGDDDFSAMEVLDGDKGMTDQTGNRSKRDLVQFVPFNKFKNNPDLLAQEVLKELPDQLVKYYQLINKSPGQPKIANVQQMTGYNEVTDAFTKNIGNAQFMQQLVQGQANNQSQISQQSQIQNQQQFQSQYQQ